MWTMRSEGESEGVCMGGGGRKEAPTSTTMMYL